MNKPPKPAGALSDADLAEQGLHWVLCGGLQIGEWIEPLAWRLRPIDELKVEEEKTKTLQRMATMAREIETLKREIIELRKILAGRFHP